MNIFGIMATPLGYVLSGLYSVIGNYGISIAILTLIVKLALYPVYKKQILSTANMGDLTPKMQAIQRKYANDRELMNEKIQELYKEEGANPMSGCLPMVIQMIIIMGLFQLVRYPLQYFHTAEMTFAVHERFLWINDLAQPDPWILPLLAGVATFASFFLSSMTNPNAAGSAGAMMKMMKYVFPIMIVWLAKTYPAGLAIYWFISQFIQIFYNLRFNQIRKKMKEEKEAKKNKKRTVRTV